MDRIKRSTLITGGYLLGPDGSRARMVGATLPAAANGARVEGFALPLIRARIYLSGVTISVAAADDFGGTKIADYQNKNLLLVGHVLNVAGTVTAPNVGTELALGLGSAVAAATPLESTAITYMAAKTGVGAAQAFTCIGHSFDESAPALAFLDAHASNNDLYINAALAVASGTGTVTFTEGSYVDVFYHDLDEPVALA